MRAKVLFFSSGNYFLLDNNLIFINYKLGSFKIPFWGYKNLPFTIAKSSNSANSLPIGHTCFNQIDFSPYPSKEVLKEKLTICITEGVKGFFISWLKNYNYSLLIY